MCRLLKFSVDKLQSSGVLQYSARHLPDKLLFTVSTACLNIAGGNLLALSHAMLNSLHHANNPPDTAIQKSRSS